MEIFLDVYCGSEMWRNSFAQELQITECKRDVWEDKIVCLGRQDCVCSIVFYCLPCLNLYSTANANTPAAQYCSTHTHSY